MFPCCSMLNSQLITFCSGNSLSQIDYRLVRRLDRKHVRDVRVIGGEECITQQRFLVGDLVINRTFSKSRPIPPRRKLWRLKKPEVAKHFRNIVQESTQTFQYPTHPDRAWDEIKSCLLVTCDSTCGWTKGGKPKRNETWLWNDEVDTVIKEKRRLWKKWQNGGDKEEYHQAKRRVEYSWYMVYAARNRA